ncbi:MAG: hypothetical protein HFE78_02500, partial [Clostridiales bacterium]|nr:hypothetical protein [Clostridiales bacterium]
MATYTEGYNLKKPDELDFVNISDINGNMDIIDGALGQKANLTYCTCSTSSGVLEKNAVVVTGEFELIAGAAVDVKFMYSHTNGTPTLNVNNTGAKAIKMYGNVAPEFNMWRAESIVRFVYDGTNWMMQATPATTEHYGVTKLSNSVSSTSNALAATPSAVKAAYDLANNAIPKSQKAVKNGIASLDENGIVSKEQLPNLLEPTIVTSLPTMGEENKLYMKKVSGAQKNGPDYEKWLYVPKSKQASDDYYLWNGSTGPVYVFTADRYPKVGDTVYYGT